MPRFAEEWRRSTLGHPLFLSLPPPSLLPPLVPRILPTFLPLPSIPPLPQRGWRAKGWLLNYLDRTKRNKWRWIGPLMRYWPITATHVYWYRRIRAARLSPHLFLSRGVFLSTGFLRRRTVSGILMERCLILVTYFPSFDFSARRPVGGGWEIAFCFFNFSSGEDVSFPRFVKRKKLSSNYGRMFWDDDRSFLSFFLSFLEWKCFLQRRPNEYGV